MRHLPRAALRSVAERPDRCSGNDGHPGGWRRRGHGLPPRLLPAPQVPTPDRAFTSRRAVIPDARLRNTKARSWRRNKRDIPGKPGTERRALPPANLESRERSSASYLLCFKTANYSTTIHVRGSAAPFSFGSAWHEVAVVGLRSDERVGQDLADILSTATGDGELGSPLHRLFA
jgi:hypothetical protein